MKDEIICPVCGKKINIFKKDSFYDAYEFDGVILDDGYSIMVEDHGPHYRFHRQCTLGYKNNGHGFYDIIIDRNKYWEKLGVDYDRWRTKKELRACK